MSGLGQMVLRLYTSEHKGLWEMYAFVHPKGWWLVNSERH